VIVCLLGTDPRFDFFTLHAQCTTPWNPSTPATRITQFSYDFDGRVTQMNAPEGVINYTYDLPTGRLTGTCTANSQIAYAYDQLGRLSAVSVLERNGIVLTNAEVTTNTYDKVGNRSTVTLPNGVVTTYLYDSLNRLTNLTHQAGTTNLATYSYKLDRTGRRTNAVEILLQEGGAGYLTNTLTWQYDGMYRLTNEISACSLAAGQYSTAYQNDKVGNRLKRIEVIGGTNYTTASSFDTNYELLVETSIQNGVTNGATGYAYDLNGSLMGKTNASGSISYTYNLANKLSSVVVSGITTAFCYNDQGIRVGSATSSSTNTYLVDANNRTGYQQVLEEFNQSGGLPSLTKSYVIGDDVLAQCSASTNAPSYFLPDGHGSTRQLVSTVSGLASHYNYDAYGQTQTNTSSALGTNTKLYCGEQFDSTLNMYNLRARYYDPSNGRFNQRDPFAGANSDPQTLHKYTYGDCNPVGKRDPSGELSLAELLIVVSIIVILAAALLPTYARAKKKAAQLARAENELEQLLRNCSYALTQDSATAASGSEPPEIGDVFVNNSSVSMKAFNWPQLAWDVPGGGFYLGYPYTAYLRQGNTAMPILVYNGFRQKGQPQPPADTSPMAMLVQNDFGAGKPFQPDRWYCVWAGASAGPPGSTVPAFKSDNYYRLFLVGTPIGPTLASWTETQPPQLIDRGTYLDGP